MSEKTHRTYEPPVARDLSSFSVMGQDPLGFCTRGTRPSTSACTTGDNPANPPGDCAPVGTIPEYGACYTGGSVAHGCLAGSFPSV